MQGQYLGVPGILPSFPRDDLYFYCRAGGSGFPPWGWLGNFTQCSWGKTSSGKSPNKQTGLTRMNRWMKLDSLEGREWIIECLLYARLWAQRFVPLPQLSPSPGRCEGGSLPPEAEETFRHSMCVAELGLEPRAVPPGQPKGEACGGETEDS